MVAAVASCGCSLCWFVAVANTAAVALLPLLPSLLLLLLQGC
jgi:hypothetical protein